MNKLICFVFIFVSTFASCSIDSPVDEKEAILKVLENQRQDWNRGNIEAYMQGYLQSDSLVFIGKSGPKYGWQTTLDNYKKGYPDKSAMGFLTFNIRDVRILGTDHAFIIGGWHLKRINDELQGSFTLLMKKVDGQWKVIVDHSS